MKIFVVSVLIIAFLKGVGWEFAINSPYGSFYSLLFFAA